LDALLELFQQHGRRLAFLASATFVVLMSLSVANTVLFFIDNMAAEETSTTASTAPAPGKANLSNINVAALNLFGSANVDKTPVNVDAPETNLNLELDGVFTAADPDDSTAIIAESGKSGVLYQIGDRLPGNATLKAVFDDHILIKRGGRLEKLMFPDFSTGQGFTTAGTAMGSGSIRRASSVSPNALSPDRLQAIRDRIRQRSREISAEQQARPESPGASIRDYVNDYQQQIKADPQAVLDKLGVAPVTQGQSDGYRIGSDVPQQMLSQAGLQQGDVILSVNGRPVGNVMNDRTMVDQAMASGRVRVEVQRGSRKFFLTVPIPSSPSGN